MVETIEKELAVCEICGGVAGTKDHLQWIAKRLGSLAYSNPTLILAGMDDLSQTESMHPREKERKTNREDIFRILCPDCRRKVFLKEEWG